MADLSRKRERDRLPLQRDPHYMKLGKGAYLGYRRGPDSWTARLRDRNGLQHYRAFDTIASDDFDGAKRAAEAWFMQMGASAVRAVKRTTVRAALDDYLEDLRRHGRPDAMLEALWRYKCTVYKDPIADVELERATQDDFEDWRIRLMSGRQPRTINRHVRAVVAGLNRAVKMGHVGTPTAWLLEPLADNVDDDGETAPTNSLWSKFQISMDRHFAWPTERGAHRSFAYAIRFLDQRESRTFDIWPETSFQLHFCLRRMVSIPGGGTCGLGQLEPPFPELMRPHVVRTGFQTVRVRTAIGTLA